MAYTEQITFFLFLKMTDKLIKTPYNRPPGVLLKRLTASGTVPKQSVTIRKRRAEP